MTLISISKPHCRGRLSDRRLFHLNKYRRFSTRGAPTGICQPMKRLPSSALQFQTFSGTIDEGSFLPPQPCSLSQQKDMPFEIALLDQTFPHTEIRTSLRTK